MCFRESGDEAGTLELRERGASPNGELGDQFLPKKTPKLLLPLRWRGGRLGAVHDLWTLPRRSEAKRRERANGKERKREKERERERKREKRKKERK